MLPEGILRTSIGHNIRATVTNAQQVQRQRLLLLGKQLSQLIRCNLQHITIMTQNPTHGPQSEKACGLIPQEPVSVPYKESLSVL